MSEQIEFNFQREYIDSNEEGISSFQRDFIDEIQYGDHNVVFLHAPTGAGKTYSFLLSLFKSNPNSLDTPTLIVAEPTNDIVNELYCAFSEMNEKEGKRRSVVRITGRNRSGKARQFEIRDAVMNHDFVITNPDILSLYISGHYITRDKWNRTNFQDALLNASVIIFDEYHSYDAQSLGKILSILLISSSTGLRHLKFVFASATPSEKFVKIVEEYVDNSSIRKISPSPSTLVDESTSRDSKKFKELRGEMKLVFTDSDITDTLQDVKNFKVGGRDTMAYIFNSVVDAERFADSCEREDIKVKRVDGYRRGRNSRPISDESGCVSTPGDSLPNGCVIVATSSLELGVNVPHLAIGHIEPGYYLENFSQRLGRFSRRGQSSTVYVHVGSTLMEDLKHLKSGRYYDFLTDVSNLISSKYIRETEIKQNARIFTYCVWKHTKRKDFTTRIKDALIRLQGSGFFLVDEVLRNIENDSGISSRSRSAFAEWWRQYFLSYGYFRGTINDVRIVLPDGTPTEYDRLHVMRWAVLEESGGEQRILRWLERGNPNRVAVTFMGFDGNPKKFDWDVLKPGSENKFRQRWIEDLEDVLKEFAHSNGGSILEKALNTITPRLLKPMGIELEGTDDNIFI